MYIHSFILMCAPTFLRACRHRLWIHAIIHNTCLLNYIPLCTTYTCLNINELILNFLFSDNEYKHIAILSPVLHRAVKTHFKKPRLFRFLKNLKNLKRKIFRFFRFFIFKLEFLLFHVKLCKFI